MDFQETEFDAVKCVPLAMGGTNGKLLLAR